MKNIPTSNLIIFFLICIAGCNRNESEPNGNEQLYELRDKSSEIQKESGLSLIKVQPSGRTWRDIYAIYRRIDEKYGDDRSTQGFKLSAISYSVLHQQLTDSLNAETLPVIAYYAEDSYNTNLCQAQSDYLLLKALKGYWSDDKIKDYALAAAQRADSGIQELEQNQQKERQRTTNNSEIEVSTEKLFLKYIENSRLYSSKLKELCRS